MDYVSPTFFDVIPTRQIWSVGAGLAGRFRDQALLKSTVALRNEEFLNKRLGGQQDLVTFKMKDFLADFHDIFLLCRDRKIVLQADFLRLGIYLSLLYEHLERLGRPQNVRQAFLEVVS